VGRYPQGHQLGNAPGRAAVAPEDAGDHRGVNPQMLGENFFLNAPQGKPSVEFGLTCGTDWVKLLTSTQSYHGRPYIFGSLVWYVRYNVKERLD
jgi:hypothetical protein